MGPLAAEALDFEALETALRRQVAAFPSQDQESRGPDQ